MVDLGFDTKALLGLVEHLKANPEAAVTSWKATTKWDGGFRSHASIARPDKTHEVQMDEPSPLGGTDTAPNMVEVVLGAYGCCLTTGLVANAAVRGIELTGVDIDVEGEIDLRAFLGLADPTQVAPGYSEIRTNVKLTAPGATNEELHELYDHVLKTSPVGSVLASPVAVKGNLSIG